MPPKLASERATRKLNDWVSFVVLPLFALSNAGVTFSGGAAQGLLTSHIAWGIVAGLVLGKPLGIVGFSKVAVKMGIARLPGGVSWLQMGAVGVLAGIGFTVSIFISGLAFGDPTQLMEAKSAVSGSVAHSWRRRLLCVAARVETRNDARGTDRSSSRVGSVGVGFCFRRWRPGLISLQSVAVSSARSQTPR